MNHQPALSPGFRSGPCELPANRQAAQRIPSGVPRYWHPHFAYSDDEWNGVPTAELAMWEAVSQGDLGSTVVYVMAGRPDGAVKVGMTGTPQRRLRAVQAGMWQVFRAPLQISSFIILSNRVTAQAVEAYAHRLLRPFWTGTGEWFRCDPLVAEEACEAALVATTRLS